MSRQKDVESEDRERIRRGLLVRALEFGLVIAIHNLGAELQGFAIKYDEVSCLLTLKADFNQIRHVSFIYSDTMMNCILSATRAAAHNRLKWSPDKYSNDQS